MSLDHTNNYEVKAFYTTIIHKSTVEDMMSFFQEKGRKVYRSNWNDIYLHVCIIYMSSDRKIEMLSVAFVSY